MTNLQLLGNHFTQVGEMLRQWNATGTAGNQNAPYTATAAASRSGARGTKSRSRSRNRSRAATPASPTSTASRR